MELYDYQSHSINELRKSLALREKPVLSAPTGSGKTRIASEIFTLARAKNKRVIFVVPFLSLINQTWKAFANAGIDDREIGIIQANHELTDWRRPVQIASAQTLERRPVLPDADIVIFDECHINRKIYTRWMQENPKVYFIGLSATPWASGMGSIWDRMIVVSTLSELISKGYLSPFKYFAPAQPDLSGVRTARGDYVESDLEKVMGRADLIADIVKTWIERGENRPTFCFCVNRKHAQEVQDQFLKAGIDAGYVDANTPVDEREALVEQLKTGRLQIICNIGTMTTGVDAPFVSCLILARPTKSPMLFCQIIGRALRKYSGKNHAIILDHSSTALNLGRPDEIHYDDFVDGKAGKSKTKKDKEEKETKPKLCPKCQFVLLPKEKECPSCGWVAPPPKSDVELIDGELTELNSNGKQDKATKDQKQEFWSGLLWIAGNKNYSRGWASHIYKERFGVWPRSLQDKIAYPTQTVFNYVKSRNIAWAKKNEKDKFVISERKIIEEETKKRIYDSFEGIRHYMERRK